MERPGFDPHISAAKGFCIIAVVTFHSVPPQFLQNILEFLPLSIFLLISGMFLKDDHLLHPGRFVIGRFRRLWVPYVLFMFIFLLDSF